MLSALEQNRSMIFSPLIVVASELGIANAKPRSNADRKSSLVRAYRDVTSSELGSVIVDSVDDDGAAAAAAEGAYTVRTDLAQFGRTHNYRSNSGAERIAATVNRFDRYYNHDVIVAVPDDMAELKPFYLQALMYALATPKSALRRLFRRSQTATWKTMNSAKVAVDWIPDRIVHPLEGSRVGTLRDIRRDPSLCSWVHCRFGKPSGAAHVLKR